MSLVVIFPVGKDTEFLAYHGAATAHFRTLVNNPNADFYPDSSVDAHDQRVMSYYGPGAGVSLVTEEPADMIPLRADGVVQDGFDPPFVPDE